MEDTHRRTTEKSEQSTLPTSTKHSSSSKTRDQARTLQVTNFASTLFCQGSACTNPNRGELQQLERFQKKVVKWILRQKVMPYPNQLRLLNILPLPMFMQLNDILLLSKLTEDDRFLPMLKQNPEKGRTNELFKLLKTRTEKARNDFFFRTCRLANRIEKYIEFNTKKGLKNRVLNFIFHVEVCKRAIRRK